MSDKFINDIKATYKGAAQLWSKAAAIASVYNQIPSGDGSNGFIESRATLFWVVFKKNLQSLRSFGSSLLDKDRERTIELLKKLKEGPSAAVDISKMQEDGSLGIFSALASSSTDTSNLYVASLYDVFSFLGDFDDSALDKVNPEFLKNTFYFVLKGVSTLNYHISTEDDNNASFDLPNPNGILYDGEGRLILNACDEISVLVFNNYNGQVDRVFTGIISDVTDSFDGEYFHMSVTVSDYTFFLRTYQLNLSPGMSHIERMFGFEADQALKGMTSSFLVAGKPDSTAKGIFSANDWEDIDIANLVPQRAISTFGGMDIVSVATYILTGQNFFNEFSSEFIPSSEFIDIQERQLFKEKDLNALTSQFLLPNPSRVDMPYMNYQALATNSIAARGDYLRKQKEAVDETLKLMNLQLNSQPDGSETDPARFGFGFNLVTGYKQSYIGRNVFNLENLSELTKLREIVTPNEAKGGIQKYNTVNPITIDDLLREAFSRIILQKEEYLKRFKNDPNKLSMLEKQSNRFEQKYFYVEPEVQTQIAYELAFDNFRDSWDSQYQSVFEFIREKANAVGLLFYSDRDCNYRLETVHCNDFPSVIIDEKEILSWEFSEDVSSYVSRQDVTAFPAQAVGTMSDLGRYMWAMCVDFDLLKRYGYRMTTRDFTTIQPQIDGGPDALSQALATAAIFSRRFMDMENGKILGGSITMHTNYAIRPNMTVYIPMRNMIYTVMSVDPSINVSAPSEDMNVKLAYGRRPAHFYEGLMYSMDAQLYRDIEILRILTTRTVRDTEWTLWLNKDRYPKTYIDDLRKASELHSDYNLYVEFLAKAEGINTRLNQKDKDTLNGINSPRHLRG